MNRRTFIQSLIATAPLALLPYPALASERAVLSVEQVLAQAENGTLLLVDVRRPSEWEETGVASVANTISMHEPGFLQGVQALSQANPDKKLAIICASGVRSAYLQREMERRGLGDIIDVPEGMLGSKAGAGWIAKGLPTKPWKR